MERKDFQKAFDSIPYAEDFNERTKQLLLERLAAKEGAAELLLHQLILEDFCLSKRRNTASEILDRR